MNGESQRVAGQYFRSEDSRAFEKAWKGNSVTWSHVRCGRTDTHQGGLYIDDDDDGIACTCTVAPLFTGH